MQAYTLHKYGPAATAFRLDTLPDLKPGKGNVVIQVEAFGLNYADIMARKGMYRDAPPKPCVIGYEVVGHILHTGEGVTGWQVGERVAAFTRFGGYATQVETRLEAITRIPAGMGVGEALALTVQYGTAWYAAEDRVRLQPGEKVLIHAAAGGVGTALVQMARRRGCIIFGTAGSDAKLKQLKEEGVQYPINYRTQDFAEEVRKVVGSEGLDVVFDSLGGKVFKRSKKLLGPSGRIVGYGAADRSSSKLPGILGDIALLFGFGFYNPAFLLMQSQSIIGVNMLRVADHRPMVLKRCMDDVVALAAAGELKPIVGGIFPHTRLADAHEFLESRKSNGKIVMTW